MSLLPDLIGQAGLKYFGGTTASISHELKNALAIIQENAGLINDYLVMAEKGMSIDPDRLKLVAARIQDQTRRADGIIKHMNRFAHSVDDPLKSVELQEIAGLLAALSQREAAMHQVTLSLAPAGSQQATVHTSPFLLLTLLGRCLSFALRATTPGQTLTIQAAPSEGGGRIDFEPLPGLSELTDRSFPGEGENALLTSLQAGFGADDRAGRITITLTNR